MGCIQSTVESGLGTRGRTELGDYLNQDKTHKCTLWPTRRNSGGRGGAQDEVGLCLDAALCAVQWLVKRLLNACSKLHLSSTLLRPRQRPAFQDYPSRQRASFYLQMAWGGWGLQHIN